MREAYFVAQLLWVSGRTLKKQITPAELAKPLLEARDPEFQRHRAEQRREDEEYLKKTFNLKEADGNDDS